MKEQTQKQRMLDAIEQLGGMDAVLERIASCESLTSIAGSLGVSPDVLGRHLNNDPRLRRAVRLARASSVKVIVERGPVDWSSRYAPRRGRSEAPGAWPRLVGSAESSKTSRQKDQPAHSAGPDPIASQGRWAPRQSGGERGCRSDCCYRERGKNVSRYCTESAE